MSEQAKIYRVVRVAAATHPEIALRAVMDGTEDAMTALRKRLSDKDAAFLSALALAQTNRLSKTTMAELNKRIAEQINPDNACALEEAALDAAKE